MCFQLENLSGNVPFQDANFTSVVFQKPQVHTFSKSLKSRDFNYTFYIELKGRLLK